MRKKRSLYLLILFVLLSALSLYRHRNIPTGTFRSELWADRAGYYVFLPATFNYQFSAEKFPKNIDQNTGNGFKLDSGTVTTKYTYGVALLQLPFYAVASGITAMTDEPNDGFSFYYRKAIDIAAAFYLVLALYLLFASLRVYTQFNSKIIAVTLSLIFFGTNLYYYAIVETGMSHIYSFFLFSCIIYLLTHKPEFKRKYHDTLLLSFLFWLIVLIRPTNILFALIPFTWQITNLNQLTEKIRSNLKPILVLIWCSTFMVLFIPQFIYWKYAYGSYLTYSYTNEGFSNIFSPEIGAVLFSPHNGLLPYSLIFMAILIGIAMLLKNKTIEGFRYLIIVMAIIYITAAWHNREFGCGAGMRNMVEYYSLLAFPLAHFVNWILTLKKPILKFALIAFFGILTAISFKVNYHYYGCYFGTTWDWNGYFSMFAYPFNN